VLVAGVLAAGAIALRRAPAIRREAGLNVLLVTIDTLRADALGAYGNAKASTPHIDRLAAEGVRFDSAHAQTVLTLPSHANILSGLHPFDHGIRDNAGFRFPRERETLATILKARGYRTAAFVSAFPLDSRFGLQRDFDVYDDRFTNADTRTPFVMEERRGSDTAALAQAWIAAQGEAPFFCWVHLYDPHYPYAPAEPFASRFKEDPYLGEVAAADAALGTLLDPLIAAGAGGRTLVVFTADHGEALGDHGETTHGIFAYEATLHVPLVVFGPRLVRSGVVARSVGHADILPTVLDALALAVPENARGQSLLPVIAGAAARSEVGYFESLAPAKNLGWAPLYGLLDGTMKYIDLPIPELYDLAADPGEHDNLAARRPEILQRMSEKLRAMRTTDGGWHKAGEDPDVRERLRSLGYVTASRAAEAKAYTPDDDPKRLIALDAELQAATDRYNAGDLEGAISATAAVVSRRPGMSRALVHLGALLRAAGRLPEGIANLTKALALSPDDQETAALLAAYLNEAGRPQKARALLEPYLGRTDVGLDVLTADGIALAQMGRPDDARASFERIRQLDPGNATALVNLATVQLRTGDRDGARASLENALALNPRLASAHNTLGVIAAEGGQADVAIEHWKQALELQPREFDTVYNIGRVLWHEGRKAEARPYLERFAREAPPANYAKDIAVVRAWLSGR
jgi:arylsulfatase A-like enzyme/Tfp pilus assembly protein PilF